jgi:hypothetical protein
MRGVVLCVRDTLSMLIKYMMMMMMMVVVLVVSE